MRRCLAIAVALTGLTVAVSPAAALDVPSGSELAKKGAKGKKKKCKGGKVRLTVGRKTRCVPIAKALPKPKAGNQNLIAIKKGLTPDIANVPDPKDELPPPLEKVYAGFGPKALEGMEKAVTGSLGRLEALAPAPRLLGRMPFVGTDTGSGYSESIGGGMTIDIRLNIAKVATAEFALTKTQGDGKSLAVTYEIPLVSGKFNGFRAKSGCPTAEGKLDATDGIAVKVRSELRSNGGKTLEAYYIFKVVDETEMQGVVGDDGKLETLEIRSIEEVDEAMSGSNWGGSQSHGTIVRNTVVDMRNGETYRPTVTPVSIGVTLGGILRLFGSEIRQETAAKMLKASEEGFAATVKKLIEKYRELENVWNTPNKCAKLEFGHAKRTLTLHRNDAREESVRVKAQPGGSPQKATWEMKERVYVDASLAGGTANPTSFSYKVAVAGDTIEPRVTVRAVSRAGVAEDTWVQKTEQDSIDEISGTFSYRSESFGSIFEAAGHAKYVRWTPAIYGGAEGAYKITEGQYTYTASGSAGQLVTPKCSMKGSGVFPLAKELQFAVFSQTFDGEPPYYYTFDLASEGAGGLPMIEIETYACAPEASELEGDKFPYPATFAILTPDQHFSEDGTLYEETVIQEQGPAKITQTWSFQGKP